MSADPPQIGEPPRAVALLVMLGLAGALVATGCALTQRNPWTVTVVAVGFSMFVGGLVVASIWVVREARRNATRRRSAAWQGIKTFVAAFWDLAP